MSPKQVLFDYVLARVESEPVCLRADLYEALAEDRGKPEAARQLRALAKSLRDADARCREFGFRFHEEETKR